jgi:hypothetical protein
MSFLDNLGKFIDSPEGRSMAAALLKNKGSFGEGLGSGLLAMEEVDRNKFKQENQNSLLGLKREGLDLQRMSTEASIQNMRQSRAESYQRLKMMMEDRKQRAEKEQQQKAMLQGLQSLIGQPGQEVQTPEIPGVPYSPGAGWSPENLPTPASTEIRGGSGLLGGKVSKGQFNAAAASVALGMGDVKTALSMLNPKAEKFGAAREVIDPATGQSILAQVGEGGTVRPIQGALPAAKNGITHTMTDGSVIQIGGTPKGNEAIGKAAMNGIDNRLVIIDDLIDGVQSSKKLFKPSYLNIYGAAGKSLVNAADYLNVPLSEDQASFPGKRLAFEHEVGRTLHRYAQSVVGSRGGIKTLEFLEKSFPNMKLKPNEMKWALDNIEQNLQKSKKKLIDIKKAGKFSEAEINKKVSDEAMMDMQKVMSKVVDGGKEIAQTINELDNSNAIDPGGYR